MRLFELMDRQSKVLDGHDLDTQFKGGQCSQQNMAKYCVFIMPRAELLRHTVVVLSVILSVRLLQVFLVAH